jgi:hypothetical protein
MMIGLLPVSWRADTAAGDPVAGVRAQRSSVDAATVPACGGSNLDRPGQPHDHIVDSLSSTQQGNQRGTVIMPPRVVIESTYVSV